MPVIEVDKEDDDGFFNHKKTVSTDSVQLGEYLCSSQTDVAMIRTWPCVASLFIRTNTALLRIAACERLFRVSSCPTERESAMLILSISFSC